MQDKHADHARSKLLTRSDDGSVTLDVRGSAPGTVVIHQLADDQTSPMVHTQGGMATSAEQVKPGANGNDGGVPPEVSQVEYAIDDVDSKRRSAVQRVDSAVYEVQVLEGQAQQLQEELKHKSLDAQQAVEQAKAEVESAQSEKHMTEQQLHQLDMRRKANAGPSIAGYKPLDVVKALAKPPHPALSTTVPEQTVSKAHQKHLQKRLSVVGKGLSQTKQHITQANRKIKETVDVASDAHKKENSILQELAALRQQLRGAAPLQRNMKPSRAFWIMGVSLLLIAATLLLLSQSQLLGILVMIVAFVQFAMGGMLKSRNQ